mmetsp:Transcript_73223/g.174513  ORF Transcript_73223/g.174513 Transcript_73223/m.174513 type:complete len:341 (+) Transcript_73223:96-1118(+)
MIVQMVTADRFGGPTKPVEVACPVTKANLLSCATKKFCSVTRKSRIYLCSGSAEELTGAADEIVAEGRLEGAVIVLSGKAGWGGASHVVGRRAASSISGAPPPPSEEKTKDECTAAAAAAALELLDAAANKRSGIPTLFWKDTQDNGYLTNWAIAPMVIHGQSYNCVEQWIMASKARVSGDEAKLQKIMQARTPKEQKGLGKSLKLAKRYWGLQQRWENQLRGVRAKFAQHPHLCIKLLRTGSKLLAEASPSDEVYGIGLAPSDPLAQDSANWRGRNLLGKALMEVREELRRCIQAGKELHHVDVDIDDVCQQLDSSSKACPDQIFLTEDEGDTSDADSS